MNDNEGLSIESLENAVAKFENPPMRKWRCTRGHTWEAPFKISGITFGPCDANEMVGVEGESFCMRCCYEWLREYCGKVREVK